MNDQQATATLHAAIDLACALRDDGPREIATAARAVLDAAGGDPLAAVSVAAALIPVDYPIDPWWARGLNGLISPGQQELPIRVGVEPVLPRRRGPAPQPCGTPAAAERHRRNSEDLCDPCRWADRRRNQDRYDRKRVAS